VGQAGGVKADGFARMWLSCRIRPLAGIKRLKSLAIVSERGASLRHERVTERLHKSAGILIIAETGGPTGPAMN